MGILFYLLCIMLVITAVITFPAGLFWLMFKTSSLFSEKRYMPATGIITIVFLALILGKVFFYEILMIVLIISFGFLLFSFFIIFMCLSIAILLAIYLIYDIFYEKKLSNIKRVAIGMLMAIYVSEGAGIIYIFVSLSSRKYG